MVHIAHLFCSCLDLVRRTVGVWRLSSAVSAPPWSQHLGNMLGRMSCSAHPTELIDGRRRSPSNCMSWPLQFVRHSAGVACSAEVHSAKVRGAPKRGPAREEICFTSAPDIFSVYMKQENPREASENIVRGKVLEKWVTH